MNKFSLLSLTLLAGLSLSSQVKAEDNCAEIDLYKTSSDMLLLPRVQQTDGGNFGICYAVVASQLANYTLLKNNAVKTTPDMVHPIWVALNFKLKNSKSPKPTKLEAGFSISALRDLTEHFNCPSKNVYAALSSTLLSLDKFTKTLTLAQPEREFLEHKIKYFKVLELAVYLIEEKKRLSKYDDGSLLSATAKFLNLESNILRITTDNPTEPIYTYYSAVPIDQDFVDEKLKNIPDTILKTEVINVKKLVPQLADVIKKSLINLFGDLNQLTTEIDFVNKILAKPCAPFEKNEKLNFEYDSTYLNKISFTNKTLAEGYPVGIYLNSKTLLNAHDKKQKKFLKSDHALLVVGSRKINNSCQYLVRDATKNEWGKDCACLVDNVYKESCDPTLAQQPANVKYLGCWVERKKVFPAFSQAFSVK